MRQRHERVLLSRTPRPPPWLAALSAISSMPSASSAATSFISELTLPRITPSLASMRWMVGSDSPADFSELALIDAEDCSRGPQLAGGDHGFNIRSDVFYITNRDCHMILDFATLITGSGETPFRGVRVAFRLAAKAVTVRARSCWEIR